MNLIKRLLLWIGIAIIPTLIIIIVWLVTLASFNLLGFIRQPPLTFFSAIFTVTGLIVAFVIKDDDLNNIIS